MALLSIGSKMGLFSLKSVLGTRKSGLTTLKASVLILSGSYFLVNKATAPFAFSFSSSAKVHPTNGRQSSAKVTIDPGSPDKVGVKPLNGYSLVFRLMLKDWKLYLLATISSILSSFFAASQARLFGKLFDCIGGDQSMFSPTIKNLLTFIGASSLCSYISNISLAFASTSLGDRLRNMYFSKVLTLDMEFFDRNKSSKLVHELTNDISQLQSAIRVAFSSGVGSVTSLITGFYFLYTSSSTITFALLSVLPPLTIVASSLGHVLRKVSSKVNSLQAETASVSTETLANISTVRSFNSVEIEKERLKVCLEKVNEAKTVLALLSSGFFVGITMGVNLIALGTIFLGASLVSDGEVSAGDIAGIVTQTQMIERAAAKLSLLLSQLSKSMQNASNIFVILNMKPSLENIEKNLPRQHQFKANEVIIDFNKVKFKYPTREDITVLDDFDLKVRRGETVALVGPSGSGKSTVFSLLQRFYAVDSGSVTINGQDVLDLSRSDLKNAVSVVSQEPVLFARSIAENIGYGRSDATLDEVKEAAKKAFADEFIEEFPEGYDTLLGERGALLSGGQKQRIAIARAILCDTPVLLLDEATSALDTESERKVQEALEVLAEGRTSIVIAHRLSTVKYADRICVVVDGKIVESGTHDDLLAMKGHYHKLFLGQQL